MNHPAGEPAQAMQLGLGLEPMISYAGNHEDVRLRRVVPFLHDHRYVEVGAGHPIDGSVTYWLYTQGWRGVLVEPGARQELLAGARPEDIVVNAAVGSEPGEAALYETSPDAGMSTMRHDRLPEVLALGQTVRERSIAVVTLTDVFARMDAPVAVLTVDVEGAEADVLASLDWERFRPTVVMVESILPWQPVSTATEWQDLLLDADYREAAFDGVNRFYVDRRNARSDELATALAYPVSALDRYTAYPAAEAQRELAATRAQLQQAQDQVARLADEHARDQEVARALADERTELRDRLDEARTELTDRLHEARTELTDRLDEARNEIERLVDEREALRQERDQLHDHASGLQARLNQISEELRAVYASTVWRYGFPIAHAVRTRLPVRSGGTGRGRASAVRRRLASKASEHRRRLVPPTRRRRLAVRVHTHPAFLRPSNDTVAPAAPEGPHTWAELEAEHRRDDDQGLRVRLEERRGVRPDDERDIQVAALAEALAVRGSKGIGRSARVRRTVLVDARSLQDPGLSTRGVGRYAAEVIRELADTRGTERTVLFVDSDLPPLPAEFTSLATTETVGARAAAATAWFVQPSPMTAAVWPLAALLTDGGVWSTTIAYDIIPWRYPDCYTPDQAGRRRTAARLRSMSLYDEVWAISSSTLRDVTGVLGVVARSSIVWPAGGAGREFVASDHGLVLPERFVLVAAGQEHRKNVVGGLAAVAAARETGSDCTAVVVGWSGEPALVAAMASEVDLSLDALLVLPYVTDEQMQALRCTAAAALVPSFAEGLSLPVIETLGAGCPVAASAIPVHEELLGPGPWLADPADPARLAKALCHVLARPEQTLAAQLESLNRHEHLSVGDAVRATHDLLRSREGGSRPSRSRPLVDVVTPWPPQPSGIADYSAATLPPLADTVDLVIRATASASLPSTVAHGPVTLADPSLGRGDALVTVIGNSHFHLPGLEVIEALGGVALCHDVRLTELNSYIGVQDPPRYDGLDPGERRTLRHELDAVPRLGFDHVARHSDLLLFHSARVAERVARETGAATASLPFVPYRIPREQELGRDRRAAARRALGLPDTEVHVGLLGGVDVRTKAADVVVEAVAWLRQWGHRVTLHVVGGVERAERQIVGQVIASAGLGSCVKWHGRVDDETYRRFLVGLDLGVQLRTAALLSLSGAAADLGAFGLPGVVTRAMSDDMGLPDFLRAVDDDFSPLLVAEAFAEIIENDGRSRVEDARREYLARHSAAGYATALLGHLGLWTP